ncbi:hypothetical protein Nmel_009787 [Mimus melanotis]
MDQLRSRQLSVIAGDTVFVPGTPEEPALHREGKEQFRSKLLPKSYNCRGSKFFLYTNMQKKVSDKNMDDAISLPR